MFHSIPFHSICLHLDRRRPSLRRSDGVLRDVLLEGEGGGEGEGEGEGGSDALFRVTKRPTAKRAVVRTRLEAHCGRQAFGFTGVEEEEGKDTRTAARATGLTPLDARVMQCNAMQCNAMQ